MICIFCALYPEAQPLIKALALKQDKACNYYKKYINDENDICLYITGTGLINAAAAVGFALSENGSCLEKMHIVNLFHGIDHILTHSLGNLFLSLTIYPEQLYLLLHYTSSFYGCQIIYSIITCMSSHSVVSDCDPRDWSLPGSCVHGISQARLLKWVAISSSRGSFRSRYQTQVS